LYNGNFDDKNIKQSVTRKFGKTASSTASQGPNFSASSTLNPKFSLSFNPSNSQTLENTLNSIPFTRHDVKSGLKKMTQAADRYDKSTSIGLKAFDEKEITPLALQDLMFRVFMTKLSSAEASGLIDHFDKDNSGTVDYAEFLIAFFQLASQQKEKTMLEIEYNTMVARDKMVKQETLDIKKFAKTSVVQVSDDYTFDDLQSALDKVGVTSSLFDRSKAPISSFDSGQMDHTGFKQQLYRNFGIRLNNKELGALFEYFDRDDSKLVDMTEFLISFFQLAPRGVAVRKKKEEEMKILNNTSLNDNNKQNWAKVLQEKHEQEVKANQEKELQKKNSKAAAKAMKKIRKMASRDETFNLKTAFRKFDRDNSGSISHEELKEVAIEICGGDITDGEIACVINLFDPNGDGEVKYDEFAYSFYNRRGNGCSDDTDLNEERVKENIKRREREKAQTKTLTETISFMKKNAENTTHRRLEEIVMTKDLIKTATFVMDQVRQKVKISLREAFDSFDEDESGTISHDELTVAITKVSGRKLSSNEAAAIIAMFDPNGDGTIAYDEFCWTFYNRREAIKKMERTMKMQRAKERVRLKRKIQNDLEKMKEEAKLKEYLPQVDYERGDAASTRTAKAATTLLGTIQKNPSRLKHSSLKQSRGCTMIRCVTPVSDTRSGKAIVSLEKEFKTKVLRFDMKWVSLTEMTNLLYRRSCKVSHFMELLRQRTFNNGFISRKDFCLTMVEGLGDLDSGSHNRLYSCFDYEKKDSVWIGEFAVGLDAISCPVDSDANEKAFIMCLFKTLIFVGRVAEDESEYDESDNEYEERKFRKEIRKKGKKLKQGKKSPGKTPGSIDVESERRARDAQEAQSRVTFVNLVTAFMTLSLDDKHDDEISKEFRHAFEKSGFGKSNSLMIKRDQNITLGGKYESVNEEEMAKIVDENERLVRVIKKLHKMVLLKVSDNKAIVKIVNPQLAAAGKRGKRKKGTLFSKAGRNRAGLEAIRKHQST